MKLTPLLAVAAVAATVVGVGRARSVALGSATPAIARPAEPRSVRAEGRVVPYPGAEVAVGVEIGGLLVHLRVAEGSRVKRGDRIAELECGERAAQLAEAVARVSEAEVDARFFRTEVARDRELGKKGAISVQAIDQAQHDLDAALARIESGHATVQRLEAALGKTRILAPIDGVVTEQLVHEGEIVSPGERLVTLTDLTRVRVEAEVDEFDTARLAPGLTAKIQAEGFPESWRGHVEEVPAQIVARRLRLQDPGRPSDMRVLLVKVAFDEATPLKLGQRVELAISGGSARPRP